MQIQEALKSAGILSLEAEVLLSEILHKDRAWITGHASDALDQGAAKEWKEKLSRRLAGEPLSQILGWKEFYGRKFSVSRDVLTPRPATEELVRLTLDVIDGKAAEEVREADTGIVVVSKILQPDRTPQLLVDIGTGSGCIGITLACETKLPVIATDISKDALKIARMNAESLHASIEFRQGKSLEPLAQERRPFLVVTNPPYIPAETRLEKEVADFEPHEALFAGPKGIDVLQELLKQTAVHPSCVGIVFECQEEQPKLLGLRI